MIGSMLEEADRLTTVVDTLLTLSRWDSGRVRPTRQAIDLRAIAEQAAGQLAVLAEDRGVVIELAIDRPLAASGDRRGKDLVRATAAKPPGSAPCGP